MEHDLDELADAAQAGRRQTASRNKKTYRQYSKYVFNDSSHRVLTEQTSKKYKLAMLIGSLIAFPATVLLAAFFGSLGGDGIFKISEQLSYLGIAVSAAASIIGWLIFAWGRFGKWWNHD